MQKNKLICTTVKEAWLKEAQKKYLKKINFILPFEIQTIKSDGFSREQKELKKEAESRLILEAISDKDTLIFFDEKGKSFPSSRELCSAWVRVWESSQPIVYVVGGAYGVTHLVRQRAQQIWSLSPYTFNHHLAQLMVLEQMYRSLSLWKNRPYHND